MSLEKTLNNYRRSLQTVVAPLVVRWVVLGLLLAVSIAVSPLAHALGTRRARSEEIGRTTSVKTRAKANAKAYFVTPAQRRMRQQQRIDPNLRGRTASREGGDAKRPQIMVYDFGHGWAYKMTDATQRLIIQDEFLLGKMEESQSDSRKVSGLDYRDTASSNSRGSSDNRAREASPEASEEKALDKTDDGSDERFRRFVAMDSDSFIDADGYRIITHDEARSVLHGHEVRYKLEVLGMNLSAEERKDPRSSGGDNDHRVSYDLVNYDLYRDRQSPNVGVPVPLVPIDVTTGRRLVSLHSPSAPPFAKAVDKAPRYTSQTSAVGIAASLAGPAASPVGSPVLRSSVVDKLGSKKKLAAGAAKSTVTAWKGKAAGPIAAIPVPHHLTKTSKVAAVPKKSVPPAQKSATLEKTDERQHVAPVFHTPYADLDSYLKAAASK